MFLQVGLIPAAKAVWNGGVRALGTFLNDTTYDGVRVGNIYFVQEHELAKQVLSAESDFVSAYTEFGRAAGLRYDFTSLPNTMTGITKIVHDAFRTATHEQLKECIALLISKHLPTLFTKSYFHLADEFEKCFNRVWTEYMFGNADFADEVLQLRHQLQVVMHERYYSNTLLFTLPWCKPITNIITWLFHRSVTSTRLLDTCKRDIAQLIAKSTNPDCWLQRFSNALKNVNERDCLVEDVVFSMLFIPDFLSAVIPESILSKSYTDALRKVFLLPVRGRVLRANVTSGDGTIVIPAGSTVFVDLVKAELYHSWGPRQCLGQAFTTYFKDAFAHAMSAVQIHAKENGFVRWDLKRGYLSTCLPYTLIPDTNTKFFDVLALNEDVTLRALCTQQIVQRLQPYIHKQHQYIVLAPEVRGLPIAVLVATQLAVPLVVARKPGGYKYSQQLETVSYSGKGYNPTCVDALQVPVDKDKLFHDKMVIVVDDGISSGSSAQACIALAEKLGAKEVVAVACPVNHTYSDRQAFLKENPGLHIITLFDL